MSCYKGVKTMLNIRPAQIFEADVLTNIAIKSEAYWEYDSNFMENFKAIYKVTEEFIDNNPTCVIEEDGSIVGFYGLLIGDKEVSLEYVYIGIEYIGKGYGKLLWDHLVDNCKNLGIKELVLVTSPQAKEFYTKMGAIPSGEVSSLVIKERKIPRLIYTIDK